MQDGRSASGTVGFLILSAKGWAAKSAFGLVDQLLFSGTSFIVNILAARWLESSQYGAFTVSQSVFLLLASLYTAIIIDPMTVFGAGKYRSKLRGYLGKLFIGHWAVAAFLSTVLALAAIVVLAVGSRTMAVGLGGVVFSLPCVLLFWFVRRGLYVNIRPHWAAVTSGCHLVFNLLGLIWLRLSSSLSLLMIFLVMGLAGLAAGGIFLVLLDPDLQVRRSIPAASLIVREHWNFGRWNILASAIYWASSQILLLLVPLILGLEANAAFGAVTNLFRPLGLLMQSTGLLLLPALASQLNGSVSSRQLLRESKALALLFFGIACAYGLLLWAFSRSILNLLYAGRYEGYSLLVLLCAVSNAASAATGVMTVILKASGDTRSVTGVWAWSAVLMAFLAIPLMRLFALGGAAAAATLSYLVSAVVAWLKLKNRPLAGET